MIKSVSKLLQEGAALDKDILEIMDESVPAFEYTSTGLDANYLEGENFIAEAYADMMAYKAEANQILIESMGSMNESAVAEMRRMIDETVKSKAVSIGFKIAQLFRALGKKLQTVVLSGQLKSLAKKVPQLEKAGVDLGDAAANCSMARKIADIATDAMSSTRTGGFTEGALKSLDQAIKEIDGLSKSDFSRFNNPNMTNDLQAQIKNAKSMISSMNQWATSAIKVKDAEESANMRKISTCVNKIVTAYLKTVSASLKAISVAASKQSKKVSEQKKADKMSVVKGGKIT